MRASGLNSPCPVRAGAAAGKRKKQVKKILSGTVLSINQLIIIFYAAES